MLLSRMAEAVYWAGRYLERAEDLARIVQVHGETHVDLPVGADVGWSPLLEICGTGREVVDGLRRRERGGADPAVAASRASVGERIVIGYVLVDRDNPSSVLRSVTAARDNLRVARPVVPREAFELVNDLWCRLGADASEVGARDGRVRWLKRVLDECARVNGVLTGTMRRDEAMAFVGIGQQLERADMTARFLAVRADSAGGAGDGDPYDEVLWMALLRSLAAYQPFRRAMPARPDRGATVRFLLQDDAFPRAVSSCLTELRDKVKQLPGNEEVLAACTDAAVLVADAPVDALDAPSLRTLMAELGHAIAVVHDRLAALYFAPRRDPARGRLPGAGVGGGAELADPPPAGAPARRGAVPGGGGGRTLRVTHRTTYEYGGPVEQSYNEAHLRPRHTPTQRCVAHQLVVEPAPASLSQYTDAYGNAVTVFVVGGGFDRLSVTATSEVVVSAGPPPEVGLPWESAQWLLDIDRQAPARQARLYRAPSRLVPASPALADYAAASFAPGRSLGEAVVDLAGRIHRDFVYEPGFTSVTTPVLDVLRFRRGVCQDFAHVGVGCLRAMGLAARYVSGYVETTAPDTGQARVGADASHAWFSAYVPGWGWLDVDPTNDQLVSDAYVTTAWGRDYFDVSPLRGSVEGGGASHTLDVAVDVVAVGGSEAS